MLLKALFKIAAYLQLRSLVFVCKFNSTQLRELRLGPIRTYKFSSELKLADTSTVGGVICPNDFQQSPRQLIESIESSRAGERRPWLVIIAGDDDDESIAKYSSSIYQELFFYHEASRTLYEAYTVNGVYVKRRLGQVSSDHDAYVPVDDKHIFQRRKNFHGLKLRAMVEKKAPFLSFTANTDERPQLDTTSGPIQDVTEITKGIFPDFLRMIGRDYNISFKEYRRQDKDWGKIRENGTNIYYGTGILGNVINGDADLIAGSLTLRADRALALDYVLPIGEAYNAVFIRDDLDNSIAWDLFVKPFSTKLWLLMAVMTVGCTVAFKAMNAFSTHQKRKNQPKRSCDNDDHYSALLQLPSSLAESLLTYWSLLMAYFGRPLNQPGYQWNASLKIFCFGISLTGTVVFMSYRASLTSGLSVVTLQKPFDSLKGLLNSEYRLVLKGGGSTANSFINAKAGTQLYNLYHAKIKPNPSDSFLPTLKDALMEVTDKDTKVALYYSERSVRSDSQYGCLVYPVWRSHAPTYYSMAFRKGEPITKFFSWSVLKAVEDGTRTLIDKKWSQQKRQEHCDSKDYSLSSAPSLGFEKLCSVFVCLLVVFPISVVLLCLEALVSSCSGDSITTQKQEAQVKEDRALTAEQIRDLEPLLHYLAGVLHTTGQEKRHLRPQDISIAAIQAMIEIAKRE